MTISIEQLGKLMLAKRGTRGVRAAAAEVSISSATFSRVENGHMPDLETFAKICKWIGRDPGEFLGFEPSTDSSIPQGAQVHLRKKTTVSRETAESLGALILQAQAAAQARNRLLG
jgi:transcriptional regulator with XRE-family HTH domain